MSAPSTLLDPSVPLAEVRDVVAETWNAVQTGEYRLCLGLRRLFRDHAHRGAGFARFADWVALVFGIPEPACLTRRALRHMEHHPGEEVASDARL